MKGRRMATACFLSIFSVVAFGGIGAAVAQRVPIPYDVKAVRKAAADIQQEIKKPRHEEESLAGPLQFIVESLDSLKDLKDVPDDILDAVVALAGSGRMASSALTRFGDRAVNPLIRSARTRPPQPLYPGGAMEMLQELLLAPTLEPPLSSKSKTDVGAMARDLFRDTRLDSRELAALGCLAVATRDPELRAAAERLTDPAELTRRGVPDGLQATVISRIKRALGTFPRLRPGAASAGQLLGHP